MNGSNEDINTCGCCEIVSDEQNHTNRPGQPALLYRIGTHASFLRQMKLKLSSQAVLAEDGSTVLHPSSALTTRSSEDASIALLDAWAMVCDVLTFYQERIANEGFLRTATERRSVLEMARAIGYELSPGVAASTYLAFTLDDSEGSTGKAVVKKGTQVMSIPTSQDELPQIFETIGDDFDAVAEWNSLRVVATEKQNLGHGTTELYLDGIATNLEKGDAILLVGNERDKNPGSERWDFRVLDSVAAFPEKGYTIVTWEEGLGHDHPNVDPSKKPYIYAFRQRSKLFGFNAPDWKAMSSDIKNAYDSTKTATDWPDFKIRTVADNVIDLDIVYSKIRPNSWIAVVKPTYVEIYKVVTTSTGSRTDFTLTGQVTRLKLDGNEHLNWFGLRETLVFCQSEELEQAEKPITVPINGLSVSLQGRVEGLVKGKTLILNGKFDEGSDTVSSEVVTVDSSIPGNETTILYLQDNGIKGSYAPSSITINANVVLSTHGQTASGEVLGSGNGAQPNQKFTLKKSPLTYVSAATARGALNTLEVRVNGVLWDEAGSLYSKEAAERIYVVRIDDDAKSTVIFGDGLSGSRLPTGQENIKATYRSGIGHDGDVAAGSLTLLKTRPFGVRGVTNPLAAAGSSDPEKLEDARTNAPLTVLTLDRIVSLQDFEDFTRAFKGIYKAQAINLWNGKTYLVHITIAGNDGAVVDPGSSTFKNLVTAIDSARDPTAIVRIDSIEMLYFDVSATVLYDSHYTGEDVKADILGILEDTFSFEKRGFAQPVTPAEIISAVHQAEGVVAVDLDSPSTVLTAEIARWQNGNSLPAQLRTINSSGINLTMNVAPKEV